MQNQCDCGCMMLKPCPFCGGRASFALLCGTHSHWVVCVECKVAGANYGTEREAITHWNTRVVEMEQNAKP